MKGKQIVYHCTRPFPLARRICLYNPSKWFSKRSEDAHGHVTEERAPSLAEEFKRVAEEKANEGDAARSASEEGGASRTADRAKDGAVEAGMGDGDGKSVKERVVVNGPSPDFRTRE